MQTFLPYPSFNSTAEVLDRSRLGKQRVETKQIIVALGFPVGPTPGNSMSPWRHHPATRMWKGHEYHLAIYGLIMCLEWRRRGYEDGLKEQFNEVVLSLRYDEQPLPAWLGSRDFHASHRSNLLRKDPEWYGQFGWSESPDLPYAWPVELRSKKSENIFS
jgi:hypothetical protein